jgi:hypothetical protein
VGKGGSGYTSMPTASLNVRAHRAAFGEALVCSQVIYVALWPRLLEKGRSGAQQQDRQQYERNRVPE